MSIEVNRLVTFRILPLARLTSLAQLWMRSHAITV